MDNVNKKQSKFKLRVTFYNDDDEKFLKKYKNYANPKIHSSWNIENLGAGGSLDYSFFEYEYSGPVEFRYEVIKNVEKFYENFNFKIK